MLQITDNQLEQSLIPVWRQAFRPFFLLGAAFAAIAILVWIAVLHGYMQLQPYGNVLFWHSHEMLFGFVVAIIVGFLLTAVQNWTGLRATHGWPLIILVCWWALARVLLLVNPESLRWLTLFVDVSFLPLAAVFFARLVWPSQRWRNLAFVPILLLLASTNTLMHVGVINQDYAIQRWGFLGAIMLITLLMGIVGGRVIPMFTANGTGTKKVESNQLIHLGSLISSWVIAVLYVFNLTAYINQQWLALMLAVGACFHAVRALRWRPWVTLKVPLVWSLHTAYWFIPVGYALLAVSIWNPLVSQSMALHSLTVGAMGGLILAMMARVSLGHTGRSLVLPRPMVVAFFAIIVAVVGRLLAGYMPALNALSWLTLAGVCWVVAFSIYCGCYLQILLQPRADGRPG